MPQRDTAGVTHKTRTEIGSYLSRFCDGFSDPRLGEFLGLSVGRILLKESRRGRDWRSIAADDQLRHIADWLKSSLINDAAWLSNVDAHGRPKKLMKFGSIDQIVQEADKAMLKAAQRLSGVKLVEGDEELYAELDDGYHLVRLLTPASLDRESAQMQHCIGDGAYDSHLDDDQLFYLSLRDASGKAHVTMEILEGVIIQLQGKQNETPVSKYRDRLIPFIKEYSFKVDLPVRVLQHVVDDNGHWHPIKDLPDGLTVSGSLDFRETDITKLPDGLTVGRSLNLAGCNISSLPDGMTVGGSLSLEGTGILDIPKGLSVGWDLDLYGSKVTHLPAGLTVRGDLNLSSSKITHLPKGLTVGSRLILRDTMITSLPDDLSVQGELILSQSSITCLPDIDLECNSIFLEDTGDITLPEGLTIIGDLYLRGSGITSLPRGLFVGGSLDLTNTKISTIPDDISVGRSLLLGGTAVTSLPEGLSIGCALSLQGLKIEELPDALSVGGDLDIREALITRIREGVTVRGKILSDRPLPKQPSNMVCR